MSTVLKPQIDWFEKKTGWYGGIYRIHRNSGLNYDLWVWTAKHQGIIRKGCATLARAQQLAAEHKLKTGAKW